MTFWKRQNYRDSKNTVRIWGVGWGGEERMKRQEHRGFLGQ